MLATALSFRKYSARVIFSYVSRPQNTHSYMHSADSYIHTRTQSRGENLAFQYNWSFDVHLMFIPRQASAVALLLFFKPAAISFCALSEVLIAVLSWTELMYLCRGQASLTGDLPPTSLGRLFCSIWCVAWCMRRRYDKFASQEKFLPRYKLFSKRVIISQID